MLQRVLLFLVLLQGQGHTVASIEIKAAGDGQFTKYLLKKMANYGEWIQNNSQDPSTPIPDMIILPRHWNLHLDLNCSIKDQTIIGYSNTTAGDVLVAETNFTSHLFAIGRDIHSTHDIKGVYDCTGLLYASADLSGDLRFHGRGNFSVQVKSSDELIAYTNLGITSNYTFNKTYSSYRYLYYPTIPQVKLVGTWDDNTVNEYKSLVDTGFISAYLEFLSRDELSQAHLNPSKQSFVKYVDEIITNTNLSEILSEEELPEPYVPTTEPPASTTTSTISSTSTPPTTTATVPNAAGLSRIFQLWLVGPIIIFASNNNMELAD